MPRKSDVEEKRQAKLRKLISELSQLDIPDVGYRIDEPRYRNGTLIIPIGEYVDDMGLVRQDFEDALSKVMQTFPVRPRVHYDVLGNSILIGIEKGNIPVDIANYTYRFLEAYKVVLDRQRKK